MKNGIGGYDMKRIRGDKWYYTQPRTYTDTRPSPSPAKPYNHPFTFFWGGEGTSVWIGTSVSGK